MELNVWLHLVLLPLSRFSLETELLFFKHIPWNVDVCTMLLTILIYEEKMFSQTMAVDKQTNPYLGNTCKGRSKICKKFAA